MKGLMMLDPTKCVLCGIEINSESYMCPSCEKESDEIVRFYYDRKGSLEGGKSPCLSCEAPTLRTDGLCRACARAYDKWWDEEQAKKVNHDFVPIVSNPDDWPRNTSEDVF